MEVEYRSCLFFECTSCHTILAEDDQIKLCGVINEEGSSKCFLLMETCSTAISLIGGEIAELPYKGFECVFGSRIVCGQCRNLLGFWIRSVPEPLDSLADLVLLDATNLRALVFNGKSTSHSFEASCLDMLKLHLGHSKIARLSPHNEDLSARALVEFVICSLKRLNLLLRDAEGRVSRIERRIMNSFNV